MNRIVLTTGDRKVPLKIDDIEEYHDCHGGGTLIMLKDNRSWIVSEPVAEITRLIEDRDGIPDELKYYLESAIDCLDRIAALIADWKDCYERAGEKSD